MSQSGDIQQTWIHNGDGQIETDINWSNAKTGLRLNCIHADLIRRNVGTRYVYPWRTMLDKF